MSFLDLVHDNAAIWYEVAKDAEQKLGHSSNCLPTVYELERGYSTILSFVNNICNLCCTFS